MNRLEQQRVRGLQAPQLCPPHGFLSARPSSPSSGPRCPTRSTIGQQILSSSNTTATWQVQNPQRPAAARAERNPRPGHRQLPPALAGLSRQQMESSIPPLVVMKAGRDKRSSADSRAQGWGLPGLSI